MRHKTCGDLLHKKHDKENLMIQSYKDLFDLKSFDKKC